MVPKYVKIGESYMFHARMIYVGRLVDMDMRFYYIDRACWMASMGRRMSELLREGMGEETRVEVDPPEDVLSIPMGSFVPHPWRHALPTESKP